MRLALLLASAIFSWPALSQAVCAKSAMTVLRKGPGTKYEKSWVVPKNMPFMKLDQKGAWIKLSDLDGEVHWGSIYDFTQHVRCVVIKANTAETRQGPGSNFPYGDFKTLDRYTPLKRLANQGPWVQVQSDLGTKSWIHESKLWHPVKVEAVHF